MEAIDTPKKESPLKTAMTCGLAVASTLVPLILVVVYIRGMVWVSEKALPWLFNASVVAFALRLFIFGPLTIFRKSRPFAATCFLIASYLFGTLLWAFACIVTFQFWGYAGLIIGLCFFGVGVVVIAFLAALFHAEWTLIFLLTVGLILTFGIRYLSLRLAGSLET